MSLNLVTDRTQNDVDYANTLISSIKTGTAVPTSYFSGLKGCYNYIDLNRVENAVKTLSATLNSGYGFDINIVTKINWILNDLFSSSDATRYISNLYALKSALNSLVPLPQKTVVATNIISNSGFSNGTSNWDNIGLSTMTVTDGIMTTIANAPTGRPSQLTTCVTGHIYYIQSRFKTISSSVQLALTRLDRADLLVAHSGSGNFETLSARGIITSDISVSMFILDYRSSGWTATDIDYMMAIDLTSSFGTGSEPTKEWCDANISYFDGTQPIIQAMGKINYEDANNIEKLLQDIEQIIEKVTISWYYSGMAYSGLSGGVINAR